MVSKSANLRVAICHLESVLGNFLRGLISAFILVKCNFGTQPEANQIEELPGGYVTERSD
jgi:hypothetical protein